MVSQLAVGLGGDFEALDDLAHGASVSIPAFPCHLDAAFSSQAHPRPELDSSVRFMRYEFLDPLGHALLIFGNCPARFLQTVLLFDLLSDLIIQRVAPEDQSPSYLLPRAADDTPKRLPHGFSIFRDRFPFVPAPIALPFEAEPRGRLATQAGIVAVATPAVALQFLLTRGIQALTFVGGTHWIEMQVFYQPARIFIGFNDLGLVATGKQVAPSAMPRIESRGVGGLQPAHPVAEVSARRPHQRVVVIAHETVAMQSPAVSLDRPGQGVEEPLSVPIIAEDVAPLIAARHHVIDSPRKFHPNRSRHV